MRKHRFIRNIILIFALASVSLQAQIDSTDMASDLAEALTFEKYPTYFQYDTIMHRFASEYPSICSIDTFGYSRQGRLLLALKISDNVGIEENEPSFFYTATMHGDELIGYILLLRLADFLLSEYGSNGEVTNLVDNVEIWLNPLSNPDETYYPDNDTSVVYSRRPYIDSLNLNRNFPDPSVGEANDTTGRQPEIRHMMEFMQKQRFNMSANLHSGAEVVNYPWDHKYERHPDDDWYYFISWEYAEQARTKDPSYMDEFTNGVTNGWDWYDIYGGRQDYVNFYLGGREVTLELSNTKKVPSELLSYYWDLNKWSLFNMISQARYGVHGTVVDRETGSALEAMIEIPEHDDSSSVVHSDSIYGKFYRYLKENTYDLVISSEGFENDTIRNLSVVDYQLVPLYIELDSLDQGTGTEPVFAGTEALSLYPNPASERVTIKIHEAATEIRSVQFFSSEGKCVLTQRPGAGARQTSISLEDQKAGFYFLRIQTSSRIHHKALIIR